MTLILFVGSLIMLVIIFFKNPILSQLGKGNPFVHLLKRRHGSSHIGELEFSYSS